MSGLLKALLMIITVFYLITAMSMDIDHWLFDGKSNGDHFWVSFLINTYIYHYFYIIKWPT